MTALVLLSLSLSLSRALSLYFSLWEWGVGWGMGVVWCGEDRVRKWIHCRLHARPLYSKVGSTDFHPHLVKKKDLLNEPKSACVCPGIHMSPVCLYLYT